MYASFCFRYSVSICLDWPCRNSTLRADGVLLLTMNARLPCCLGLSCAVLLVQQALQPQQPAEGSELSSILLQQPLLVSTALEVRWAAEHLQLTLVLLLMHCVLSLRFGCDLGRAAATLC